MLFKPQMIEAIEARRKTVTRRPFGLKMPYRVGRTYAIQPGRGKLHVGHITILSKIEEPLLYLTQLEAQREGFDSPMAFYVAWREMYGAVDPGASVWRLFFEYVGREECCH